jgi:ABC-type multidrug transport system fused ATPase/permease subunit
MNEYIKLKEEHLATLSKLNKRYNLISSIRLITALAFLTCVYFYVQQSHVGLMIAMIVAVAFFIYLMNIHANISWKRKIEKALIQINTDEIAYLKNEGLAFDDGIEFQDTHHAYAYDLDIFGTDSLFQHLNRTATFIGKEKLSALLLHLLPNEKIKQNQEGIKELAEKLRWRQYLLALSKVINDNKKDYHLLMQWSKSKINQLPQLVNFLRFALPILFFVAVIMYAIFDQSVYSDFAVGLFLANLFLALRQFKRIKAEMLSADKISETIKNFSLIIDEIEKEDFKSEKLKSLKNKLTLSDSSAGAELKKLSSLFGKLDTVLNIFVAIVLNGLFLYHLHVLSALLKWKKQHASQIPDWIDVIGEFEALNSLANFTFNNPQFAFPELNTQFNIEFVDLSHPLIKSSVRVDNSVTFDNYQFIVLTGSNMSGKSTFLRTLGINMVLAGTGAPVCASKANIHPLKVLVSMRLADSLSDSESYFFAEVKRLKEIMTQLENETSFVLLDEILRGTNSDDKRKGTIGVIKKMIAHKAIGAIATHDLEVCLITDDYPNILSNQCFEVEIVNNELAFDYKLRAGVCKNKSATFLMEKMEII